MHDLIHTRVAPPTWVGAQIRRDLLLARLDEALSRRLTVIHAPAGYGKTSLLAQWRGRLEGQAVLVAWLTLERDDADLARLAQYIALAIDGAEHAHSAEEGLAEGGERMSSDLPSRAALSAIVNRLAREPRPVVLILDDLHRAEGAAVTEFLTALIRLAPANCHFVVASRDYPWLGQSILAAAEQVLELLADDLKFSAPEAEAMLARAGGVFGDDDVQSLVERTEGWPIALQLASLSLKRGADQRQLVSQFSGPSSELARYLSEQVLATLPDEMRQIVIRTALVDRLNGEVVNLLCDRDDGWLILERLEQQGLFLTPLSSDRKVYRYHQLFAEYLREHLARGDIGQFRSLQRRAARWFARRGEVAEAVDHAILANDDGILTDIIEEAGGWRLIPQGMQPILERGLQKLREAIIVGRPRLLLARVYLAIKQGEVARARTDYDRFLVAAAGVDLSADLWTEIRVVGDTLADYENVPVSLDDLLDREALLRALPADDHLVLANFTETLGAKYLEGGWLERALEPTLAARDHYQALGSLYSDLFTRFLEARIKRAQGRHEDAVAILAAARLQITSSFGERSDLAANCAAFEAELLYEQDRRAEARSLLDWALTHMEQSDGWVSAASGDRFRGRFLKALSKAFATRSALGEPDGLNDAEATILRHLGQGISNKEIARLIGMSPDTVKYRLKSIFRKIDVTTRRDAVRVSRERGLLIPVEGPSKL